MRKRALENAEESKETLGSIVRLVNQIENMPVGKDVTEDVKEALDALDKVRFHPLLIDSRQNSWLFFASIGIFIEIFISVRCSNAFRSCPRSRVQSLLQPRHARSFVLSTRTQSRCVYSTSCAYICAVDRKLGERGEKVAKVEEGHGDNGKVNSGRGMNEYVDSCTRQTLTC